MLGATGTASLSPPKNPSPTRRRAVRVLLGYDEIANSGRKGEPQLYRGTLRCIIYFWLETRAEMTTFAYWMDSAIALDGHGVVRLLRAPRHRQNLDILCPRPAGPRPGSCDAN